MDVGPWTWDGGRRMVDVGWWTLTVDVGWWTWVGAWLVLGCCLVGAWLLLGCCLVAAWLLLGCAFVVCGFGCAFLVCAVSSVRRFCLRPAFFACGVSKHEKGKRV